MEKTNGIENNGHVNGNGNGSNVCGEHTALNPTSGEGALATCPACGSMISQAAYDKILNLDAARVRQVAGERAELERERKAVGAERAEIVKAATEAEKARWQAEAERITRAIDEAKTQAESKRKQAEARHKKELEVAIRRRAAHEARAAKQLAVLQQKAADEAVRAAKEAKRQAEREQRELVETLRKDLATSEARRARDEVAMKRQIAEMARKAEGRDRGHMGPEGEEQLAAALRDAFPGDLITRTGVEGGGDVLQAVVDRGRQCGLIVHESKNVRVWDSSHVKQTLRDMERHKTPHGILVSRVLPAKEPIMCVINGVIVVVPEIVTAVVSVLRDAIVALDRMSVGARDRAAKEAALLDFVRGADFTAAMKRIAQTIAALRTSLEREKSAHASTWTLRESGYLGLLRETAAIDSRIAELLRGVSDEKDEVPS